MLILAPLHGYTYLEFRNAYAKYFGGIDEAFTPFIPLVAGRKVNRNHLRDVLPQNNCSWPLVPQVIGNDINQFITMGKALADLGYDEINWNLGCPMPLIAGKQRGSGLLPHPGIIRNVLENVIPNIPLHFSVKTRLGYFHTDEIFTLLPVFNDFPIKRWIIHPRLGKQIYTGTVNLSLLPEIIRNTRIPLVYNGDITDSESYNKIKNQFPEFNDFMIGRGILQNPFLPQMLKGIDIPEGNNKNQVFRLFFMDLAQNLINKGSREKNIVNKLKEYWGNFSGIFEEKDTILRQVYPIKELDEFLKISELFILSCKIK